MLPTFAAEEVMVPFTDYSRWERRPIKHSPSVRVKQHSPRALRLAASRYPPCAHGQRLSHHELEHSASYTQPASTTKQKPSALQYSHASLHGGQSKPSSPTRKAHRKPEPPAVRYLKIQLAGKQESLGKYQEHKRNLGCKNLELITSILQDEDRTHTSVKELLERYQKFKGALGTLQQRAGWDLEVAQRDLEETRERLHFEVEALRRQVSSTEATLQAKTQELGVLLHYKEKEYPVKLLQIEQLQEQVELQVESNKEEIVQLEAEVAEERERCRQQMLAARKKLESQATEASLASMPRSVQEKAIQNKVMEKEILIHREKSGQLQQSITELRSKIRKLRHAIKEESKRKQPLLALGKCLPDTELQLDIPLQQYLPV